MVSSGNRAQSFDTSKEAREVQLEAYLRMTPQQRLAVVEDANRTARLLTLAGLASRAGSLFLESSWGWPSRR